MILPPLSTVTPYMEAAIVMESRDLNIALCVAEWIYRDLQNYEGGVYWTLQNSVSSGGNNNGHCRF